MLNNKEALLYAEISKATYLSAIKVKNFRLTAKFENKGTDTEGFFGVANGDTMVVAFRGSEETGIDDWLTDLKFSLRVYPFGDGNENIKIHQGFLEAYQSVRDAILKWVGKKDYEKVACTGHSLGAALATLAALDIRRNVPNREVCCYTYGSPRVGNKAFARFYNKYVPRTYRVVNGSDAVPTLPPFGYKHVGELCSVGEVGGGLLDMAAKATDHLPHNYIHVLRALT